MNDKPEYSEKGAFKGMRGMVFEIYGVSWLTVFEVDFSQTSDKQIYCIVEGNDLRIVKNK